MQQIKQNTAYIQPGLISQTFFNHKDWKGFFEPLVQVIKPQWSTRYTRAQVVSIREESSNTYTLVLSPRSSWGKDDVFQAGQYVALWVEQNGRWVNRYFSVSSSPAYFQKTGLIELTIQSQYKGKVTPWLKGHLHQGDMVGISKAMGEFTRNDIRQPALFLAAGSGITPFRSMLQEISESRECAPTTLIYYARGEEGQVFAEELNTLGRDYPWIDVTLIDTRNQSRINAQQVLDVCRDVQNREVYICGSPGFIGAAQKVAKQLAVPREKQFVEQFQLAGRPKDKRKGSALLTQSKKQSQPSSGKTLLEIAEAQGATPTSGCRMGICHQCKCKKSQGTVMNVLTGEYSGTGEETIQLCVSMPIGNVEIEL